MNSPSIGELVIPFDFESFEGVVLQRPNRFVVSVARAGSSLECHLHDPGRLKDLIYPGNSVLFRKTTGVRTSFSITAARKGADWILTDSRFHNAIAKRFLSGDARAEVRLGKSRIDFLEGDRYVEVKGCSLETGGTAMFPDAPSIRATRHLKELVRALTEGNRAAVMVLVFSKNARIFEPNLQTDPSFYASFYNAVRAGVEVRVLRFSTDQDGIRYRGRIPYATEKPLVG